MSRQVTNMYTKPAPRNPLMRVSWVPGSVFLDRTLLPNRVELQRTYDRRTHATHGRCRPHR